MEASCGLNTRQIQGYLRLRLETNATMGFKFILKEYSCFYASALSTSVPAAFKTWWGQAYVVGVIFPPTLDWNKG